MDNIHQQL